MQTGLRLKNLKFFKGLRNFEENNAIPTDQVYECRNARFSDYTISSKRGWQELSDELTGGTKFMGLYEYPYFSSGTTTKRLIALYNNTFRQYDPGTSTWTSIATVWPSVVDADTQGIVYNNVLYFVNPMSANVDGIGKLSNTTFSVVASSPRGIAIESWVERLWVIGDYDAPNAVIASRAATAAVPLNIEDWTTGTILELLGKGGRCTAIRVLNNELFIWKEDGIWYNTPDRVAVGTTQFIELSRTGGAVNQKSTIVVENDVWFLTPNLEVRSLGRERSLGDNPRTRELSSIIRRTMKILDTDQSNAVASYFNRIYKLSLRTIDSPSNNITIIFDYDTGGWSVDRGQSIDLATVWDNQLVYTEDSLVGQAYLDESGYSGNEAAFVFDFKTPFLDDNRPDTSKRARYLYIRGQQSFTQEITVRLFRDADFDTYSEYTIQSPSARGVSQGAITNDGQWGSRQWGDQPWGGDSEGSGEIPMYRIQNDSCGDWLISIDRRCNMFAIGVNAQINGGKVIIEQMGLKLIDDNENYKRVNQ